MERWKIVPREPDTLMRLAARKAINKELDAAKRNAVYTAMLSASPPVTEEVVERVAFKLAMNRARTGGSYPAWLDSVGLPEVWWNASETRDLRNRAISDVRAVISAIEGNDG